MLYVSRFLQVRSSISPSACFGDAACSPAIGGSLTSSAAIRFPALSMSKGTSTGDEPHVRTQPMGEEPDEYLIARICEGDKQALGTLFHRYARLVRGVGYKVLRDASEADDLLQDAFLSIHRKCGMFDSSKGTARSWIVQIAYSRAIDRRRRLASRHFYTQVALDSEALDVLDLRKKGDGYEQSLEGAFGNKALKEMFEVLSENQRETLRLFFFEGCTFDEIAVKVGQSRGNIKHHYFRGLDRLRKLLFAGSDDGHSEKCSQTFARNQPGRSRRFDCQSIPKDRQLRQQ